MAVQDISFETTLTTATANAPLGALRGEAGTNARRIKVLEVSFFQKTAGTAPNGLGLALSTNAAAGGTTVGAVPRARSATTSLALGVVQGWTTAPTIGTIFKRWLGGTAIGNAYPFTFDRLDPFEVGLGGAAGGELVLVNLYATTPPIFVVNFAIEVE